MSPRRDGSSDVHILGISCYFHDAAAALLGDGVLVAAAEEERFTRVKHDFSFPRHAIRFCLDRAGIRTQDLDYVAFFEKPFVKFERILLTALGTAPRSATVFRQAMTGWLLDKLWVKTLIRNSLDIPEDRILFVEHHESHAASAYFCSPFDEAAILTVDGVGEWTTTATGRASGNTLQLEAETRFPHSLGLLYSAFTAFLGFEVNEGEYKVMGMAPYGVPRYVDRVLKTVKVHADGSFALDLDYFTFHYSATRTYSSKFEALFGAPRRPERPFFTADTEYPSYFGAPPGNFGELAAENQHYADIAASIQAVTEDILLGLARAAHARTGSTRLCMAGGVALNSVANGRILRETPFTDLYIQPSAGDGGAALGAALHVAHAVLGQPRRFVMEHASWGQAHDEGSIRGAVAAAGLEARSFDNEEAVLDRTADLLASGRVVGWMQGPFEWGPRALGHRSILAHPGLAGMKDLVNVKIKFREPYRPFAPSALAERAGEFFEIDRPERHLPARFMLLVTPVRDTARDRLPAITHVDGSARLQTVFAGTNPRYHSLIHRFGEATGLPVLLNTSFNLRGEPIVNTPSEALSTFTRSGMDGLVMGNTIVLKEGV
jgi:carbamoyltransferase